MVIKKGQHSVPFWVGYRYTKITFVFEQVNVIVSVSDVNNKAPIILDPGTVRVHENAPMGVILTQIVADDSDERPNLRYWIDHEAGEARNEKGFVVRDENVTSWFEINTTDGRIRVIHQLDREKAETVRLALRVEDVAASTPGQTASGIPFNKMNFRTII